MTELMTLIILLIFVGVIVGSNALIFGAIGLLILLEINKSKMESKPAKSKKNKKIDQYPPLSSYLYGKNYGEESFETEIPIPGTRLNASRFLDTPRQRPCAGTLDDMMAMRGLYTGAQAAFSDRNATLNRVKNARQYLEEDMLINERLDWWNDRNDFDVMDYPDHFIDQNADYFS